MNGILRSESLVRIDYIQICDAHTLKDVDGIEGDVVVALAAYLGKTRLIDNLVYRKPT
jgi:pantoate--beta-alanine ligase